jgi:undecaprenyl-diphosphatase
MRIYFCTENIILKSIKKSFLMPNNIQLIDEQILFYIQEHLRNPALDRVMVTISTLGNAGFLWIAVAFLLLTQKRYQKCGLTLICAIALATFFGEALLKPLFGRLRPCNKFPEVALLIHRIHSPSFPSGHTMVAFASATVLRYYHRGLGIAGFLAAGLMAFSRLYLFVHYPTDILGGMLFGVTNSLILLPILNRVYHNMENNFPSSS